MLGQASGLAVFFELEAMKRSHCILGAHLRATDPPPKGNC